MGGADGPQRVVLVEGRQPEHRHHRIADELLDRPAVAVDDGLGEIEVRADQRPQRLRVKPLPEGRRAGHVDEQDRDRPPRVLAHDLQPRPAHVAEPGAGPIRGTTDPARDPLRVHGRQLYATVVIGSPHHPDMPDWFRRRPDPRELHRRAGVALDEGRLDEALAGLRELDDLGFRTAGTAFDIALVHKFRREWADAVAWNRRASELDPAMPEAHWNRGVAATALRDWEVALEAWRALGIDVGPGPIPNGDFGATPVRLDPDGDGEVVWARRIDPCRARLLSIPTPSTGHRWGDVVLHDVVPAGTRMLGDQERSVFDELIRMDPSPYPTHEIELEAASAEDVADLEERLEAAGLGHEDWTQNLEMLCATCSRSGPHRHDDGQLVTPPWTTERRFAAAGSTDEIEAILAAWASARDGRGHGGLSVRC